MKSFKEYLTESVKTYAVRIKVAGELPESFDKKLKEVMSKYEVLNFKKTATTPIQEHPHEFPKIKNEQVNIYDIEAGYPISFPQIEQVLSDTFGISQDRVKAKHPSDPTEESMPPAEGSKLMDAEYKDDTSADKPLVGDEYNMTLFKELMDARKKSDRQDATGTGKIVDMGKEQTDSPIVSNN